MPFYLVTNSLKNLFLYKESAWKSQIKYWFVINAKITNEDRNSVKQDEGFRVLKGS